MEHPLDATAVRERYRAERDKRMSTERSDLPELVGDLARYLDDPYTTPQPREPITDQVDALVIGAGFGGLLCAVRLKEAGISDVRIVDSAGDVGGVWYWNRYPGAMCDIESYIYMPLLEELGYVPSQKYALAPEILGHAQAIARRYGLYDHGLFHTEVTGARWDDETHRWKVTTDRGDSLSARFLVLTNGPFSRPKLPAIPGIETFAGHSFHTSRWDYDYTGGGPTTAFLSEEADTSLPRLAKKRVGIIGTGATAIQAVPPLGRSAEHLYVFQRTPSTVALRANRPTDPTWVQGLEPGWQRQRMENFTTILAGGQVEQDLVGDGWTDLYTDLVVNPAFRDLPPDEAAAALEQADLERMDRVRARIDHIVENPATANGLKPYYRYLCKRACFHDEYLPTFNLPNVTLVDTGGRGVERVVPEGLVVNGTTYPLDCIVFATGFEVSTSYSHRIGFEVVGREALTLTEKWSDGMATLHGLTTRGFPNLFVLPGINSQSVLTANFMHPLTENSAHVAHIVAAVLERGATCFEVSAAAEQAWVETIIDEAIDRTEFFKECTPGYQSDEGQIEKRPPQNANYGGGPAKFYEMLAAWRASGELPGLELAVVPLERTQT